MKLFCKLSSLSGTTREGGNIGPAPVALTRQYNQNEESDGKQLCYLFVKNKTSSSLLGYLQIYCVNATLSVKNKKASIDKKMVI